MRDLIWVDGKPVVLETAMQCSPAQLKIQLHRLGLLDAVNQIAATDPEAAILWEFATVMERNSPFIAAMASNSIRAFTDAEIDAIFAAAAEI